MNSLNSLAGNRDLASLAVDGRAASRQPLRVLLVEDNPDDVQIILRLLRRGGYEPSWLQVQTAETLEAALAHGHWDIVLSDYTMPQFDALRALSKLREQSAHLPFIVVSGSIGEETAVAAMRAGASDYLMKGNLTRLVPAIERELRESAERQERARTKKALLALQEKFEIVFREYLDVMLVLDARDGRILHANEAAFRVLGYHESRLAGLPFAKLWPETARAAVEPLLETVHREGCGFYSGAFQRTDGDRAAHGPASEPGFLGPLGSHHRDVARRERAPARRRAHRPGERAARGDVAVHRRGSHHDGHPGAHLAAQRRGRAAHRLEPGRGRGPAGRRGAANLLRAWENSCAGQVREVLRTGDTLELTRQVTLRARDGRAYAVALTAAPIRGGSGRITGVVTIVRDITSEQKVEEELQKASKLESVALLAGGSRTISTTS